MSDKPKPMVAPFQFLPGALTEEAKEALRKRILEAALECVVPPWESIPVWATNPKAQA
jgi:hypothetical protein